MLVHLLPALAWLGALIGGAELLTIQFAARDSDAGRRFRSLNTAATASGLDQGRNRRWHHEGAGQRATATLLLAVAVVGVAHQPWYLVAVAWAVAGGWSWRRFDPAFARRFGKDADYLGTTAETDRLGLGSLTMRRVGTGVALAGALAWGLLA